jgi:hypothetical protein
VIDISLETGHIHTMFQPSGLKCWIPPKYLQPLDEESETSENSSGWINGEENWEDVSEDVSEDSMETESETLEENEQILEDQPLDDPPPALPEPVQVLSPPMDSITILLSFQVCPQPPDFHVYRNQPASVINHHRLHQEHKMIYSSLPKGIWVKTFESRLDLLSALIQGPDETPYANSLFLFDIFLSSDFPNSPPGNF